jgi:hypothetical protein
MNKLEQGAESFKQFVQDEYNKLTEELKKVEASLEVYKADSKSQYNKYLDIQQKYLDLEQRHKALTTLSLKLTEENERLSKHVKSFGNLSIIETLELRLQAMNASHAVLIKKEIASNEAIKILNELIQYKNKCLVEKTQENYNVCLQNKQLMQQNDELINLNDNIAKDYNEICQLKDNISNIYSSLLQDERLRSNGDLVNTIHVLRSANIKLREDYEKMSKSSRKYYDINQQLIGILESLGYGVGVKPKSKPEPEPEPVNDPVKPETEPVKNPEPVKYNTSFLKDLLMKGLGNHYHVEVVGGDANSRKVMEDLFSNAKPVQESGRNKKRDAKGRYSSK